MAFKIAKYSLDILLLVVLDGVLHEECLEILLAGIGDKCLEATCLRALDAKRVAAFEEGG